MLKRNKLFEILVLRILKIDNNEVVKGNNNGKTDETDKISAKSKKYQKIVKRQKSAKT